MAWGTAAYTGSPEPVVRDGDGLTSAEQFTYLMIKDFLSTDRGSDVWISENIHSCMPVRSRRLAEALRGLSNEQSVVRTDCAASPRLLLTFSMDSDHSSGAVEYDCGDLCGHTILYTLNPSATGLSVTRRSEIFD